MIDLGRMNKVKVQSEEKIVRVQGGALWEKLDRELSVHGLATPGGLISSTGVVRMII
jgi:FAD/FMN-containing dehydrogenase